MHSVNNSATVAIQLSRWETWLIVAFVTVPTIGLFLVMRVAMFAEQYRAHPGTALMVVTLSIAGAIVSCHRETGEDDALFTFKNGTSRRLRG